MRVEQEFYIALGRVVRVMPTFLFAALFSCFAGYFFGVPLNELAVVVAVPLVIAFIISRILVATIPSGPNLPNNRKKPSFLFRASALSAILSAASSLVLTVSGLVYRQLGLYDVTSNTFKAAIVSVAVFTVCVVFGFICVFIEKIADDLSVLLAVGFWKIISFPTRFANRLLIPPGDWGQNRT